MSQRLYEKYFPLVDEQEDERLKAEWAERVSKLRSLVQSPGWAELRQRLDLLIARAEVRRGPESDMLCQIGRREGLLEIRDLFTVMEQELRNEQKAGD